MAVEVPEAVFTYVTRIWGAAEALGGLPHIFSGQRTADQLLIPCPTFDEALSLHAKALGAYTTMYGLLLPQLDMRKRGNRVSVAVGHLLMMTTFTAWRRFRSVAKALMPLHPLMVLFMLVCKPRAKAAK